VDIRQTSSERPDSRWHRTTPIQGFADAADTNDVKRPYHTRISPDM
jgi:hypothetical protein